MCLQVKNQEKQSNRENAIRRETQKQSIPVQNFEPLGGTAVIIEHLKQVGDLVDDRDALGHDAMQLAEGLQQQQPTHSHTE
jgi:hypothetical protein